MPLFGEEKDAADIAIVGLGPGGLACALDAAKQGKKVVALTNRSEYIRGPRVVITPETEDFLREYTDPNNTEDIRFWDRYLEDATVQIKDVERFLYRKLSAYPNVTIVDVQHNPIASVGRGKKGDADYIEFYDGTQYYTHHMVAADGVHHGFADIVSRSLGIQISYGQSPIQDRHRFHATVQLKLKEGETIPNQFDSGSHTVGSYREHGWEELYKPQCIMFPNSDLDKFYWAGEIPKTIFEEPDEELRRTQLLEWACIAIYKQLGITPAQLEYRKSRKMPAKDKLQATVFELNMRICHQAMVDLSHGVFAQIGDGRRSSNYKYASGLNDAIATGRAFARGFASEPFDRKPFEETIQMMDEELVTFKSDALPYREELGEPHYQKLLKSIDHLAKHLSQDPIHQVVVRALWLAKEKLLYRGDEKSQREEAVDTIYAALKRVVDTQPGHQQMGLLYRGYTAIDHILQDQARETKRVNPYNELLQSLDEFKQHPF